MKKHILILILCSLSAPALANLEIAGTLQLSQTTFEGDSKASYSKGTNSKVGALLLLPLFPGLSLRTGLIQHDRKMKGTDSVLGAEYDVTDKINEIPLNLQLGLPITDLYVFGGLVLAMTQSTTYSCGAGMICPTEKTKDDSSANIGLGYDIVSFALVRIAVELEFQKGTKTFTSGNSDVKQSQTNLGLVAAFGL